LAVQLSLFLTEKSKKWNQPDNLADMCNVMFEYFSAYARVMNHPQFFL